MTNSGPLTRFVLIIIIPVYAAYITFDTGYEERFTYYNHTDFQCRNKQSWSYTNNFHGQFEVKPQIIISQSHYDMDWKRPSEYTFELTDITTTYFTSTVTCPQTNTFYGLKFTWIAINDPRVEVISVYNQNMTNIGTKQYTYSHSNMNALQGFITKFSFGFIGLLDYILTIDKITTNEVVVNFTSPNQNFLSLGYQVVLGNIGAFTLEPIFSMYIASSPSSTYDTGFLPYQGTTIIYPYCGIYWTQTDNIRQTRIDVLSNSTGIQYKYQSFLTTTVTLYMRRVWFNLVNNQTFVPYQTKKFKVTRMFEKGAYFYPRMTLIIKQLNIQSSTDLTQEFLLDTTYTTLQLNVNFSCRIGYIITGKLLKCLSCTNQNWIINQKCYGPDNYVKFSIVLNQSDSTAYQKIKIVITANGFLITQPVTNQGTVIYNVGNLSIDSI